MDKFLDLILSHNSTANPKAYVACGQEDKLAKFTRRSAERGVTVVHKWTLMDEDDSNFVKTLQFDQLGIIDRVVLEQAGFFFGIGGSSYSFMLGMERHVAQFGNLNYVPPDEPRQFLLGGQNYAMWNGITW
jgi:hypothetical protein